MTYEAALDANQNLIKKIGAGNAHLVWALGLYLERADFEALASEALTDGPNDKKIDFILLDRDARRLVFAQGYYATSRKESAPANKASDLNTAAAWLISGTLDDVPEQLREILQEARQAIEDTEIDSVELLYVHNLPESVNVAKELQTAQEHLQKAIQGKSALNVTARELGSSRIENLFRSQDSHIAIKDIVQCPAKLGFSEEGQAWKAHVLSVPGLWLHQLFTKYGDQLFSANYRGFLGISKRRKINTGIRSSAEGRPGDFWVFNNGITLLTLGLTPKGETISLTGIAIINGAQTTGSIGSVETTKHDLRDVRILCRVIQCSDPDTIEAIVKYNNTQNEITTWDQYSNDPDQERIEKEFLELGHSYSRKRGFQPTEDQLCVEEVAQPVVAFAQRYLEANRGKNRVFERKPTYSIAFAGKKARHILLAYALAKAIDERRTELKGRSSAGTLISVEDQQLRLLRNLRFKYFLLAIVASSLESALGTKVDPDNVGFTKDAASKGNYTLVELVAACSPLVNGILTLLAGQMSETDLSDVMGDEKRVEALEKTIQSLVYTSRQGLGVEKLSTMIAPA